jgi:UDP-2,4-diacetamido-2,4,6-trideoxy-beta-L-altropyranose hydrolase
MRVIVLADGGPEAGLGHVSRATGLTAALRERGVDATFVVLTAADPPGGLDSVDVVVLDSYCLTPDDLRASAPVAVFHDVGEAPGGAALVIDGADFDHACLRPEYWDLAPRTLRAPVESVIVATGAGAELGPALVMEVRRALPTAIVRLVRGPYVNDPSRSDAEVFEAPDSLADLLLDADLAVVTAGQTMVEAAAAGTPTVAVVLVENQRRQAEQLAELGAVELADSAYVSAVVAALATDFDRRRRLSAQAQQTIDGQGARRVAALVEALA